MFGIETRKKAVHLDLIRQKLVILDDMIRSIEMTPELIREYAQKELKLVREELKLFPTGKTIPLEKWIEDLMSLLNSGGEKTFNQLWNHLPMEFFDAIDECDSVELFAEFSPDTVNEGDLSGFAYGVRTRSGAAEKTFIFELNRDGMISSERSDKRRSMSMNSIIVFVEKLLLNSCRPIPPTASITTEVELRGLYVPEGFTVNNRDNKEQLAIPKITISADAVRGILTDLIDKFIRIEKTANGIDYQQKSNYIRGQLALIIYLLGEEPDFMKSGQSYYISLKKIVEKYDLIVWRINELR